MPVGKRLRYEIFRRDNHACRYCGRSAPQVSLTVDHVVPVALGGSDEAANLATACADCNAGKSASAPDAPIVAEVASDALRWAAAMQYASETRLRELHRHQDVLEWFDREWTQWTTPGGTALPRDDDWENSVLRFHAAGLPAEVIRQALRTAMKNTRITVGGVWRYFCGICWRELDSLHEMAAAWVASAPDTALHAGDSASNPEQDS